jgi:1-acyl-sn-glycerol-3-phosphate acyltransferase
VSGSPLASTIAAAARFAAGAHVTWLARPQARQSVFFANHTSHLDFVVLWSTLPREMRARTRPVAAQDYWDRGLRRWLAVGVFNAILVPRQRTGSDRVLHARDTIDRIAESIGDRYSVIVFPEGTRGTGDTMAPFKSGLYHLCLSKPGLQLVPAYIENLNRVLPKGEFLPVPFISRVTFGAPTFLAPSEPKAEFLERMREAVLALKPA